jgi:hypothetical protein
MHPEFIRAAVARRVEDLMESRSPHLPGRRRLFGGRTWDVEVHRGGFGIRWPGRGHRTPPTRRPITSADPCKPVLVDHARLNVIDSRC